jgi:tRNA modification GTPase
LRGAFDLIDAAIAQGDRAAASDQIDRLLDRADVGQHLLRPWRVALAGRPNAGKSTLINALVGYTRAIVHHLPGTTRDVVTADAAFDGWPVELSDMAGLRSGGGTTETEGVRLGPAGVRRFGRLVRARAGIVGRMARRTGRP